MDHGKPPQIRPGQASLSKRSDRRGVVVGRTPDSARQTRRTPARGRCPGGAQRCHARAEHRLPMAIYPKDLPPRSTVHEYFQRWQYDGTLGNIHHALYMECREQIGREASPTACVIDGQSVKGAEKGGPASIPMDTMPGRKSKARSAMFPSIPQACCCTPWFIRRTFRTVTAECWFCRPCSAFTHFFDTCSPAGDIRGRNSRAGRRWRFPDFRSKS